MRRNRWGVDGGKPFTVPQFTRCPWKMPDVKRLLQVPGYLCSLFRAKARSLGQKLLTLRVIYHDALLRIMQHDNKRGYLAERSGTIAMVQLEALGQPHRTNFTVLTQISEREVRAALMRCR